MKTKLIFSLAILLLSTLSYSCKKDPDDPNNGNNNPLAGTAVAADNNNYVRFNIDGTAWEADKEVQALASKPSAMALWNLQIYSTKDNGDYFQISIQKLNATKVGTGAYPIEGNTQYGITVQANIDGTNYTVGHDTPPGVVNITKLSGESIAGDFEMKFRSISSQDSLIVTGGSFASNNYGEIQ